MKTIRRRTGPRLSRVAGMTVLAVLLTTLATAREGDARLYPPGGDAVTVYLVDNGFHTDLALPSQALAGHIAGVAAAQATAKPWILIGYGDRRFFIEQGPIADRVADGLRSLFVPGNPSVLRFDGLAAAPDRLYADGVTTVRVSPAGLKHMVAYVDASLAKDRIGAPIPAAAPPAADSRFFAAKAPFSLIHLCNHWTGELLNAAGMSTLPVLDTFPAGLKLDVALRAPRDAP